MTIFIVTPTYASYRQFLKSKFPYYSQSTISPRDFEWLNPDEPDRYMSSQRGNIYMNPYNITTLPEWMTLRFTEVQMIGPTRHHSFGPGLYGEIE